MSVLPWRCPLLCPYKKGFDHNDRLGSRYEIVFSTNPNELRAAAELSRKVGRLILADEFDRIADRSYNYWKCNANYFC